MSATGMVTSQCGDYWPYYYPYYPYPANPVIPQYQIQPVIFYPQVTPEQIREIVREEIEKALKKGKK